MWPLVGKKDRNLDAVEKLQQKNGLSRNKMVEARKKEKKVILWYGVFFCALGLFLFFSLTRIDQTIAQDELHWLVAAKTYYANGMPLQYASTDKIVAFSPHLYLLTEIVAFSLFGEDEAVARAIGVVSGLISIIIVFIITKCFSKGSRSNRIKWAALSSLLYGSIPAAIQGSVIIDIDNTLLIPAILALVGIFAKYHEGQRIGWAILMGLTLTTALWIRVTTPTVVALLLSLYAIISKKAFRWKVISITAILSGAILFMISWKVYCNITEIPFFEPFIYSLHAFQSKTGDLGNFSIFQILNNLISVILWLGIFSSALFFLITIQKCVDTFSNFELRPDIIFLSSGAFLMGSYILIGGSIFGFPKYLCPAIPLVCISVCLVLSQSKMNVSHAQSKLIIITVLVGFLIQILGTGDMLYVLRFTLRDCVSHMGALFTVLEHMIVRTGFLLVSFGILLVIYMKSSPRRSVILLLILFSIGTNTGMALLQSSAEYHTGYNYGGVGTIKTAKYIREKVSLGSTVIAPSEIIYYLKLPNSKHVPNTSWTNVNQLKDWLRDRNTSGFVYSITTNTIDQVRTVSSDRIIQKLLCQYFDRAEIGSYVVWIRKRGDTK